MALKITGLNKTLGLMVSEKDFKKVFPIQVYAKWCDFAGDNSVPKVMICMVLIEIH